MFLIYVWSIVGIYLNKKRQLPLNGWLSFLYNHYFKFHEIYLNQYSLDISSHYVYQGCFWSPPRTGKVVQSSLLVCLLATLRKMDERILKIFSKVDGRDTRNNLEYLGDANI